MGLAVLAYLLQFLSGGVAFYARINRIRRPSWLKAIHYCMGMIMVFLILLLLAIGLVGTIGHYGSLGHSPHLAVGIFVVFLTVLSAWSSTQIENSNDWARTLHISINIILFGGLIFVSLTGWEVVQKYLP